MSEPLSCSASVILDSLSPAGHRLTTLELVMPRFLLAQWNTHRAISRNAASSRAIPTEKLMARTLESPFIPCSFGSNKRGMQAGEALSDGDSRRAEAIWLKARDAAVEQARQLLDLGLHKQWANRLLEPFLFVKVLASATEWGNLLRLRLHDDAQPEFQQLAQAIFSAREASMPRAKLYGSWHLPYISKEEYHSEPDPRLRRWSVARCARLGPSTAEKDDELFERLLKGSGFGHWSPFEHVAAASWIDRRDEWGNFRGWRQYRKTFAGECG